MAQQSEPVKRLVTLKLIKAGMDSRQVIGRFEAERQALALMDHPNIARVLDGGTTSAGRPYFVMDLVRGVPITRYCDEHHLTPRQRLELFTPVCQAIQHAHQKGIIHRDLKPTNVLVALYDGKPVPKVIDFGVATHLGKYESVAALFFQQDGSNLGTATLRAANGDGITMELHDEFDPITETIQGTWLITGGTGRFAGASGSGSYLVVPDFSGLAVTFDIVFGGSIDY